MLSLALGFSTVGLMATAYVELRYGSDVPAITIIAGVFSAIAYVGSI